MESRVNSVETEVTLLKSQMESCQAGLIKDIEQIRDKEPELPKWLKNAVAGVLIVVFGQTVSSVWWASEISVRQASLEKQVDKNTLSIEAWPLMHQEVMLGLAELKSESGHMKEMLHELKEENASIKAKQFTHFKNLINE